MAIPINTMPPPRCTEAFPLSSAEAVPFGPRTITEEYFASSSSKAPLQLGLHCSQSLGVDSKPPKELLESLKYSSSKATSTPGQLNYEDSRLIELNTDYVTNKHNSGVNPRGKAIAFQEHEPYA